MPYRIRRRAEDLVWVVMEQHLLMTEAEAYYRELWQLLDSCPRRTDLLVDGRRLIGAEHGARQRTEQIARHGHLGRIAFVVAEQHLLIFSPFVRLVSKVGLFGTVPAALHYLGTVLEPSNS
jgi:hypothetical protein